MKIHSFGAALLAVLLARSSLAQSETPPLQSQAPFLSPTMAASPVATYGPPISLDRARFAARAAQAEADRQGVKAAIAIVDPSGELVWFERTDDTQTGSIDLAKRKAVTAAVYRRNTVEYFQSLRSGNLGVLTLGVVASPGGEPLVVDGHVVGAIGVSGGVGMQDSQIADAAVAAIK